MAGQPFAGHDPSMWRVNQRPMWQEEDEWNDQTFGDSAAASWNPMSTQQFEQERQGAPAPAVGLGGGWAAAGGMSVSVGGFGGPGPVEELDRARSSESTDDFDWDALGSMVIDGACRFWRFPQPLMRISAEAALWGW